MNGISSDEAIRRINNRFDIMDYIENPQLDEALDKAISDMQKVKILKKENEELKERLKNERAKIINDILNMAYCSCNEECWAEKEKCLKCHDYKINFSDIEQLK